MDLLVFFYRSASGAEAVYSFADRTGAYGLSCPNLLFLKRGVAVFGIISTESTLVHAIV